VVITFQLVQLFCCGEICGSTICLETSQDELLRSGGAETCGICEADTDLLGAINDTGIGDWSRLSGRQDSGEGSNCEEENFHGDNELTAVGIAMCVCVCVCVQAKVGKGERRWGTPLCGCQAFSTH
jgi:hypothetical protein